MYTLLSPDDLEEEIPFSIKVLCSSVQKTKFIKEVLITPQRKYQAILYALKTNTPYSLPFLQKVSKKEAPDYLKVINKPMDLGLISRKISNYTVEGFLSDLELVWTNCLKYNSNNIFSEYCHRMKELCYKVLEYSGINGGVGVELEGNKLKGIEGEDNELKGVNGEGTELTGVGDKDNELEGVNGEGTELTGVGDKDNELEGVKSEDNEQRGVNNTTDKQPPFNNCTNEQKGVNNDVNKQHPFNHGTNEQRGVSTICYKPKEYWCYGRTSEIMGYFYSKECNKTSLNTYIMDNTPLNSNTDIQHPLDTTWDGEFLCNSFPFQYNKGDVSRVGVLLLNKYKNVVGLEEIKWGFQKSFKGGCYFKRKKSLKVSFLDKECVKSVIGDLFVIEVGKTGFKKVSKMAVNIAVDVLYKRVLDICRECMLSK